MTGPPPMAPPQLGFTPPSSREVTDQSEKEARELIDYKFRLLTELAALENGIPLMDFLDPARDDLLMSVTDVPCSVELIDAIPSTKPKLNIHKSAKELASIIVEIGTNPSPTAYNVPRQPPKCSKVVSHAKLFYAQHKLLREQQAGLRSAFCLIPNPDPDQPPQSAQPTTPAAPEPTPDQSKPGYTQERTTHPFFPDIKGIRPLLGHMKEQLGEFPSFIRNPPDDEECEELRRQEKPDALSKHLFEICGSSSDDDFDPDIALEAYRRQSNG